MDKRFYIYRHIRLDTNTPFYIGKGSRYRFSSSTKRNPYWQNIVNKVGFKAEIIYKNLTNEAAYKKEIEMIKLYKIYGFCEANLTDGGNCGPVMKGKENPAYGKKHSEEVKQILKLKRQEFLKKFPDGKVGGKNNGMYGKISPFKGKKHKPETITLFKTSRPFSYLKFGKPIICLNNQIEYPSIRHAAESLNIHRTSIDKVLKGTIRAAGGFKFKYKNQPMPEFKSNKKSRTIICNETGEVFSSAKEIGKKLNRLPSNLSLHLQGKTKHFGGFTFKEIK